MGAAFFLIVIGLFVPALFFDHTDSLEDVSDGAPLIPLQGGDRKIVSAPSFFPNQRHREVEREIKGANPFDVNVKRELAAMLEHMAAGFSNRSFC